MSQAADSMASAAAPALRWRGVRDALRRLLHQRLVRVLISVHLASAAIVLLRDAGWLQLLELAAYDRLVVAAAGHAPSDRLVLVAATEDDIARLGWPLRDADLAAVLDRLTRWKARVVGVDLYRDRPLPPGSEALNEELRQNKDILWVYKLPDEANQGVAPPALLAGTSRAVLADIQTDAGGVVRRGLLMAADARTGKNVRTLGLALAESMTGARLHPLSDDIALGQGRIPLLQASGGPYVAVDAAGYQTLLDYRGGIGRFRRLSISDILDSDAAAAVAGRAVIVGSSALSVQDSFATPFSTGWNGDPPLVGMALHAQLADQLVRAEMIEPAGRIASAWWLDVALIWLCAMLGGGLSLLLNSVWLLLLALVLGTAGLVCGDYAAFAAGLILPGVPCVLGLVGSAATADGVLYAVSRRERFRLQRAFEHYLDPRIITNLLAAEALPTLGGEHREISVLFTDIEGFTTFAETMPVNQVADLLHAYFDGVCGAAMQHGGLVSEFTGDGVLCLFGAPQDQPDHASRAVSAALAIDAFAERFSAAQRAAGIAFGRTRIGVHTGVAMVGNLGTSTRLRYGAIGDLLNTASRIEGLNRRIGTRVCVSRDTAERCATHRFQLVGEFVVKGRQSAVAVTTPLREGEAPGAAALARYDAAYAALRDADASAPALFAALAGEMPGNSCVVFHCKRIAAGEHGVRLVIDEK